MLDQLGNWLSSLSLLDVLLFLMIPLFFDVQVIFRILFIRFKKDANQNKRPYYTKTDPPVNILIAARDEESSIRATIESALSTIYPKLTITVIVNGSSDDTWEICQEYAKKNLIKLLHLEHCRSKAEALNYGILHSDAEIFITVDGDTMLDKYSIMHMVRAFDDPDVQAVCGNVKICSGDKGVNNIITELQRLEYLGIFEIGKTFSAMLDTMLVISGAFGAFRRSALFFEGLYNNDSITEDMDKSLKVRKMGCKITFVKQAIAYTMCPKDMTTLERQRQRWAHGLIKTILKHKDVFFSSRYPTRFRLALISLVGTDIILNMMSLIAIVVLLAIGVTPIITNLDFSLMNQILVKLSFLSVLYCSVEATVLLYLRNTTRQISLKSLGLAPIMSLWYRPWSKLAAFKGYLTAFVGKSISW